MSGSGDTKNTLLREKLASGVQIIGPGVYDGLSARIADASGFDVLYLSGYGVSASLLAKPDNGFLSASDMQARIKDGHMQAARFGGNIQRALLAWHGASNA